MEKESVSKYLLSDDPLSIEALNYLANYQEEDNLIDYKETFHPDSEQSWLEITKDIMAFANTKGGYLLFGIRDGDFQIVGLDETISSKLTDTNNFLQKANRFIDPPIKHLRSKELVFQGKSVVGIFVPESIGITHVISRNGSFKYPSGQEKIVLREGQIYIRKSAGNQLIDARTIDEIINKRIEQFRDALLGKIARVIEAPAESEVFVLSKDPEADTEKFIIEDAPEAIPIKGLSFTVSPNTSEEEIAAALALSSRELQMIPPATKLWEWYENRAILELSEEQKIRVSKYYLINDMPVFFWLQNGDSQSIKDVVLEAISNRPIGTSVNPMLEVSAFLGKRFYLSAVKNLGKYADKLANHMKNFPVGGPESFYKIDFIHAERNKFKGTDSAFHKRIEKELTDLIHTLRGPKKKGVNYNQLQWTAKMYDYYLYSQTDKYVKKSTKDSQ